MDIEIEERTSVEIVASLLAGHAEFGVIADSADHHGLEVRPLHRPLTVIATARSALAARTTISFEELLEERFVGLTGGALTEHLSRNAANLGRRIDYRVQVRKFGAIAELVGAGIGVSILPFAAAERYRTPELAMIRLTNYWRQAAPGLRPRLW